MGRLRLGWRGCGRSSRLLSLGRLLRRIVPVGGWRWGQRHTTGTVSNLILLFSQSLVLWAHLYRIKPTATCKEQEEDGKSSNPFYEWVLLSWRSF